MVDLASSLDKPKYPFDEQKLIDYLTHNPLESVYDWLDDSREGEAHFESIVYFESAIAANYVALYFLEYDVRMKDHSPHRHGQSVTGIRSDIVSFVELCR